jgi:hypothetical protein
VIRPPCLFGKPDRDLLDNPWASKICRTRSSALPRALTSDDPNGRLVRYMSKRPALHQRIGIVSDTSQRRARELAEARFKRPTQGDKDEAMAEYKAKADALHERTQRLRKLRLAHEAKEQQGSPGHKPAAKRQKPTRAERR